MQTLFHIKLAIRSLRYNLKPAVLLCLSVTTGLVAFMMISGYFTYERRFDRHFPESENIFRIITDIYSEGELKISKPQNERGLGEDTFLNYPFEYTVLEDFYNYQFAGERKLILMLKLCILVLLVISSMNLFSMAWHVTLARTKEIGIRKVNGAKAGEVMAMLNFDFVKWVALASVVAIPAAWYAMSRWLQSFAYKTELSWWIFALAGVIALGIALLTVSWQSWRAARRNPVEALRYE